MLQKSVLNRKISVILLVIICIFMLIAIIMTNEKLSAENLAMNELQKELEENVDKSLEDIDFSDLVQFENSFSGFTYEGGITQLFKDILSGEYNGGFADTFNLIINMLGVSLKGFLSGLQFAYVFAHISIKSILHTVNYQFSITNLQMILFYQKKKT